jgi:hypothetical protein
VEGIRNKYVLEEGGKEMKAGRNKEKDRGLRCEINYYSLNFNVLLSLVCQYLMFFHSQYIPLFYPKKMYSFLLCLTAGFLTKV